MLSKKTRPFFDKKTLQKRLTPGTWVEILWEDAPPEVGMIVSKPEWGKGDVSLHIFYPNRRSDHIDSHAVHSQVSNILGATCPVPISPSDRRLPV